MSIPEHETATQSEPTAPADSEKPQPTLEEQLATAEQRRKDTQSSFTKGQQAIKALEAEKAELLIQLQNVTKVSLTTEEQESLDSLKYEDPDAWRIELNRLEKKAKSESSANLEELTGKARGAAELKFELDRRQQVLNEFNESAELPITAEVIANDVPPRITSKLEKGEISFEEFLSAVDTYRKTGKVVKNEKTLEQPDMNQLGGGKTPTDMKPEGSLSDNYSKDLY